MNPPVFVLNALFAETLEDPLGGDLRFRAWRLQELGAGLSILRLKRGRGEGRGVGGGGGGRLGRLGGGKGARAGGGGERWCGFSSSASS